jgi:hypothetical protein
LPVRIRPAEGAVATMEGSTVVVPSTMLKVRVALPRLIVETGLPLPTSKRLVPENAASPLRLSVAVCAAVPFCPN